MTQTRTKYPAVEGAILFSGSILAVAFPFVIVPLALVVALAGIILNKLGGKNPVAPSITERLYRGQIVVTTRVILLLLFGTLPLMLVKSHLMAIGIICIYNLLVLAMIVADILLSPRPENLFIERRVASKLSIARANKVEIVVTNNSHRAVEIELIDGYPEQFQGSGRNFSLKVGKRTSSSLTYQVTPPKRGCYFFTSTVARYRGILELVIFQESYGQNSRVEVYPDITSISRFDAQMRRGQQTEIGLITERKRGTGSDFESLREYVKGDEFRRIDWKASARKNKLIAREFQSEVNQSILLAVDCSRSMGAVVDNMTLLDHAVNSALVLGYQVMKKGDKIGLITFSDKPQAFLPPGRGKAHFYSFVRHLYAIKADRVEPDYDTALRSISTSRLKRSLVMIVTDLTSGEAVKKMLESIPLLSRKHLPVVISVIDPKLKQAANGIPESSDEIYQKIAARCMIEKVKDLSKLFEKIGIASVMITPDQLNSSLLSHYLKVKLRNRL